MVDLIIFSKNRAFQLEALLRSLKERCDMFKRINVIVKWTSDEYRKGYQIVSDIHADINFIPEQDLKYDTIGCMKNKYTSFMVDDMVCYNDIKKPTSFNGFEDSIWCLRLGPETKGFTRQQWAWEDYQITKSYFDYPCSLDGNIFPTEIIEPIIRDINFVNPNKLEVMLWSRRMDLPKIMNCWGEAKVLSMPLNRVSETATASFGEKWPYTQKRLNELFLEGQVMDFRNMDFSDIRVPHKEIELKFCHR